MNLKEAFRYQNYLETLMHSAISSITDRNHALTTTKHHLRSKANPEAEDLTETIETEEKFFPNDDVIAFIVWLVEQRQVLSEAIYRAKAGIDFDIDAEIEANKFRQQAARSIQSMLRMTASKVRTSARDYKFDINGEQKPYYYDVEVEYTENYDRESAKEIRKSMIMKADTVSSEIDAAMINTTVDYEPRFDVNDSFDDVMTVFTAS